MNEHQINSISHALSDELKTVKFQVMISPSEAEFLDNWSFKNRIRSRSEAIRRLCRMGIAFDHINTKAGEELERLYHEIEREGGAA